MADRYVRSGAGGSNNGTSWANAFTTLAAALTAGAAGDRFWLADDHAETAATAKTLTSPGTISNPCYVQCVDRAGSVPPVSADLRTTAVIESTTTNAGSAITLSGSNYIYGVTFKSGNSTNVFQTHGVAGDWLYYRSCAFIYGGITNGAIFCASSSGTVIFDNTTISTPGSGSPIGLTLRCTNFVWKNTPTAFPGSLPTTLFNSVNTVSGINCLVEGVDLSALGSGKTLVGTTANGNYHFKDCKLGSSVTVAATPTNPAQNVYATRTDSTANYRSEKYSYTGTQTTETTVVHTGGASDGSTVISWKLTTTANSKWVLPLETIPIAEWGATTGANVTATVEGLWNAAALPNNNDIWLDMEYSGAAGAPLGSFATGSVADAIAGVGAGAAVTASTEAWDSLVTARANTHLYSVGEILKTANNAGRIFFCTTGGTSAGSEPAGYASAVDGGSVTDGTAVFRAAVRFKLTAVASSPQPQQAGALYVYPKVAKASSTFYLDPHITLS